MLPALSWLVWLNPANYAFALVLSIVISTSGPSFKCAETSEFEVCEANDKITPGDVLEHYDLDTSIGICFAVLFGMYVLCFFLGYFFLRRKVIPWTK